MGGMTAGLRYYSAICFALYGQMESSLFGTAPVWIANIKTKGLVWDPALRQDSHANSTGDPLKGISGGNMRGIGDANKKDDCVL